MAKLHLEGGVTFEGTPEEIKAYTDLYAEKAQEKPEPAQSFKEGDVVVITANTSDSENSVGDIGKITEIFMREARVEVPGGPKLSNWSLFTEMRHATQAEREQYEEAIKPKKPKLKAGDWVTVDLSMAKNTDDDGKPYFHPTDLTDGKAYEVLKDDDGDLYFLDDGGDRRYNPIASEAYEIVAPPSVFERIGREEGEFKVGDIVRVITGEFTRFEPGTIGKLVSGAHFICPRKFGVKHGDTTQDCYDDFELIATVESRVDAN